MKPTNYKPLAQNGSQQALDETHICRQCKPLCFLAKPLFVCGSWECYTCCQAAEAALEQLDQQPDYQRPF